ncbi:hypothetical protein DY000_02013647 [Brassica cretica]|uniref:Uncharacterized protein n=1 Tax=Brassica cretica TaxID=69181 RepID=A0ABQ7D862_BRACR|nr:hypothetical protein DY000_02013647 [Brassica cretica]
MRSAHANRHAEAGVSRRMHSSHAASHLDVVLSSGIRYATRKSEYRPEAKGGSVQVLISPVQPVQDVSIGFSLSSLSDQQAARTLDREAKAHLSAEANGAGSSGASSGAKVGESEGRALASHQLIGKGMDQEVLKRADLEAFFKALKESGNTLGNTLGYSYAVHTLPTLTLLRVSRV